MAKEKKTPALESPLNTGKKPIQNKLFYGDNLDVLRRKIAPDSVDLCYIDPPFNSKRNYFQIYNNIGREDFAQAQAFVDTWEWGDESEQGYEWLTHLDQLNSSRISEKTCLLIKGLLPVLGRGALMAYVISLTLRIIEIHRVLKPTGSFYLHCDPTVSHYLKLILDSIFCGQGGDFRNEIIWKRRYGSSSYVHKSHKFGAITDTIFYYTKSDSSIFNPQYSFSDEKYQKYVEKTFRYVDEKGRRYRIADLANPALRPNLIYEYKGYNPPPNGWAISREKMEQWDKEGRLHFPKSKTGRIQRRRFHEELMGKPIQSMWDDIDMISSQSAERLGYPTQKPEALLERIIKASSNEGDVVLDAYCGCGTTVAVAQRLNRNWIGIDITYQSISLILKRLQDRYPDVWPSLEANLLLDGVPRDMASAKALANRKDDRTRKEFEKWALLTYSKNQARINEKKGADGGIDGIAYFMIDKETHGKVIFQVKSGGANRATIATLNSDRQREKAEIGILITMDKPTKPMLEEARLVGKYTHPLLSREDDRIKIVTIEEILDGARLDLPMGRVDIVKSATAISDKDKQISLSLEQDYDDEAEANFED